jgi:hypothetical protein
LTRREAAPDASEPNAAALSNDAWRRRFQWPREWYVTSIASDTDQHIAMLRILLATSETTLDAFRALTIRWMRSSSLSCSGSPSGRGEN